MKNLTIQKPGKSLLIIAFLIIAFSNVNAQPGKNAENIQDIKKYKHTLGWDLFSVNYSYAFLNKYHWQSGITIGAGIGLILSIDRPNYRSTCMDCDGWSYKQINLITTELTRIGPFIRYNYFRNNYLELFPYLSSFSISGYGETLFPKMSLSTGTELSVFFGWERLKFGTGFRFSILFFRYSENNPANNDVTEIFLRPLIIHYHF